MSITEQIRTKILCDIESFSDRFGLTISRFGMLCVNNNKLHSRISSGDNITLDTIGRIYDFMETYEKEAQESTKKP